MDFPAGYRIGVKFLFWYSWKRNALVPVKPEAEYCFEISVPVNTDWILEKKFRFKPETNFQLYLLFSSTTIYVFHLPKILPPATYEDLHNISLTEY